QRGRRDAAGADRPGLARDRLSHLFWRSSQPNRTGELTPRCKLTHIERQVPVLIPVLPGDLRLPCRPRQTRGAGKTGRVMRHYLVVANHTLKQPELSEKVRAIIDAGPCDFFLLVPATRAHEPVRWTPADAVAVARRRLDSALEPFR